MVVRGLLAVMMAIVLVGCGGDVPVAFGSTGKPLLEKVKANVVSKNVKDNGRIRELIQTNQEKGNMTTDEKLAMAKILDYMDAGKWEEAQKLVDGCVSETSKTLGPGNK
ncbi:hypothetical protein K2X85_03715 [bacterium]|jgi:hypothetical protein|nr:hypothetical protein [bacterium]